MKKKASMVVVEKHGVSGMGRSECFYSDDMKDNRCYGVTPEQLGLKSCEGMRIRVTMELLGPHKKVKPHKNPWAHDKTEDAEYVKWCRKHLKAVASKVN